MKDNIRGFSVDASPLSFKNKLLLFRSPQSYVIVNVIVFTQVLWRELLFVLVFVLSLITKCLITVNVTDRSPPGWQFGCGPHGVRQMVVNPVV